MGRGKRERGGRRERELLFTLKKEGNFAIWENFDEDNKLREIGQMQTNSA